MLLSHVDLIEKLLNYAPLEKWCNWLPSRTAWILWGCGVDIFMSQWRVTMYGVQRKDFCNSSLYSFDAFFLNKAVKWHCKLCYWLLSPQSIWTNVEVSFYICAVYSFYILKRSTKPTKKLLNSAQLLQYRHQNAQSIAIKGYSHWVLYTASLNKIFPFSYWY